MHQNKLKKFSSEMSDKHKINVLLACADSESEATLCSGLKDSRYSVSGASALQADLYALLKQHPAEMLILQVDSPDKTTLEVLKSINAQYEIPIVMFSTEARSYMIEKVVEAGVSAFVVDGLSQKRIPYILDTAIARFNSIKSVKDELQKTKTTLVERKYIDKAKGLLMQQNKLSEDEAYTKLRKIAMEGNKRIGQVAQDVVRILENIS